MHGATDIMRLKTAASSENLLQLSGYSSEVTVEDTLGSLPVLEHGVEILLINPTVPWFTPLPVNLR